MRFRFDKNDLRKQRQWISIVMILLLFLTGCFGDTTPTQKAFQSSDAREVTWYYFNWMARARYAPVFYLLDTESSLGPYAKSTKEVSLKDLVKMHGHPCDGLVTASLALSVGLKELYPEGVIDRTDTGAITNNSPCYGDAAAYLTGARIRFGTQKIDTRLRNEFILYRFSTGKAVKVSLKPGLFPEEVKALEGKIRSDDFTIEEMRRCQRLQWEVARMLLNRPPDESFTVEILDGFSWKPDRYENMGSRGDIANKNILRRRNAS